MSSGFPPLKQPPAITAAAGGALVHPLGMMLAALQSWLANVVTVVNSIRQGKLNAVLAGVSLTANSATTVIQDPRLSGSSWIGFCPTTAHAAAELAAGTLYVSARASGSVTLANANNAQADRTFDLLIIG